jgi:hypothetical protein
MRQGQVVNHRPRNAEFYSAVPQTFSLPGPCRLPRISAAHQLIKPKQGQSRLNKLKTDSPPFTHPIKLHQSGSNRIKLDQTGSSPTPDLGLWTLDFGRGQSRANSSYLELSRQNVCALSCPWLPKPLHHFAVNYTKAHRLKVKSFAPQQHVLLRRSLFEI